jgi:hypothetical protein
LPLRGIPPKNGLHFPIFVLAIWVNRTKLFQDMKIKTAMKAQTTKPARGGIPRTRPAAPSRIQSILVPIDFSAPSKSALPNPH